MKDLKKRIEELQGLLKKHRRSGFKELPTRTIFIDPLLGTLGWDVRDPDEVVLEYPTIDNKSVDYALKINGKPVILVEAKALDDQLEDVKALTQVVGYAANDGVEWCVLTNGIRYKVYSSSQKTAAPNKLLFEVSIDPDHSPNQSLEQIASHLTRISRDAVADKVLDHLGEEIFTTAKVRKALDILFSDQDEALVRLVRKTAQDDSLTPAQIRSAFARIWRGESSDSTARSIGPTRQTRVAKSLKKVQKLEYTESHHTDSKPVEVVELYRALDRICQDFGSGKVVVRHMAKYVAWEQNNQIFCTAHLLQSGLRVWLKLEPRDIPPNAEFARDVSQVGHWGVGKVELAINSMNLLRQAESMINESYVSSMRNASESA